MKRNSEIIVLIVSSDSSDIYFANRLIKEFKIDTVIVERKQYQSSCRKKAKKLLNLLLNPSQLKSEIKARRIWWQHYKNAELIDEKFFGKPLRQLQIPSQCKVLYITPGDNINDQKCVDHIRKVNPDIIALCGCSLLKKEIIEIPKKGILNLHGGLPQRYRGVWTTMWAVYNHEIEYVGATVHYVCEGIDDGEIIYQSRPEISLDDDHESMYCKVVDIGTEMMCQAIRDIASGEVNKYRLESTGNLYLGKMVTAEIINKAWANIENGAVKDYLSHKEERDKKVISMMQGAFHRDRGK